MNTLKIIKLQEGVFKHVVNDSFEQSFYNTKLICLEIDNGSVFFTNGFFKDKDFFISDIELYDGETLVPFTTMDDFVIKLDELKYPIFAGGVTPETILDIELIYTSPTKINNGTDNFYSREKIIWDSETQTEFSRTPEFSEDGITWDSEPSGTLTIGWLNNDGFAQDTFQLKDCEGNPIGDEQDVIKVVQIAKQTSSICNTSDISDPIVEAINNKTTVGKKHDLFSFVAEAGDILTIDAVFSTVSMFASKGEFKIENTANDFSSYLQLLGGNLNDFIEISNDGIGTLTNSTDVPQSLDTRANSTDLEASNNTYTITCTRDGVLQLDLYKL